MCPHGIAACPVLDRIYVVDHAGACVKVYQSNGCFLFSFGSFGNLPGQLDQPVGIAVTPSAIYVTDRGNAAVSVFDTAGECQMHWSSKETGKGTLSRPGAISLAKDGSLFVSEHLCSRVSKFNADGSWALTWGSEGRDEGMFRETGGIRVVDDGTVWVGDIYNRRAQQFNQNGEYLSQIYLPAAHPTDFMLDAQGRLLVLDGLQQIIRRFDADGNRVADLGKRGGGLGEFAGGHHGINRHPHILDPVEGVEDAEHIHPFGRRLPHEEVDDVIWIVGVTHRVRGPQEHLQEHLGASDTVAMMIDTVATSSEH
jgi:DNA-binding beta-propeller fold protein YncE